MAGHALALTRAVPTRRAAERALLALLALAAAALLPEALSYPGGSQYFPTVLLGALLVLCLAGLLRRRAPAAADAEPFFSHGGRFGLAIALMALATLVLPSLGFFSTAVLLILAMTWLLGLREPRLLLAALAGYLAFVWLVFQQIFQREVPREFFMPWILGY